METLLCTNTNWICSVLPRRLGADPGLGKAGQLAVAPQRFWLMEARRVWLLNSFALECSCWICKGKIRNHPVFPTPLMLKG